MEYKTKYNKGDYLHTCIDDETPNFYKYGEVVGITVRDWPESNEVIVFYHILDDETQNR